MNFDVMKAIQIVTKAAQIAQVAGTVLKAGGEAAASIKAGLAKAGVEVTPEEWASLDAGWDRIAETAKREMGAQK